MFIIYAIVLGILLGYIMGGSLKNTVKRPLYWKALALLAFAVQIVIFNDLPVLKSIPGNVIVILHSLTYICLLVFIIRNIRTTGIPVIGLGIFSNALVIFLNGGYMPTIPKNLQNTSVRKLAESISQDVAVNNSIGMSGHTLLPWLGDIFVMPSWVPLSNVFSIGDVLIGIGICLYMAINMKKPRHT